MLRLALAVLLVFSAQASAKDFALEDYFAGKTRAVGAFSAINGVKRGFVVTLTGHVRGGRINVIEDFVYSDGERARKTWNFTKIGLGRYTGTREDVIGSTTVRITGNTAKFTYLVDLDDGKAQNIVRFYDTMRLSADGKTVKNRALVTKYGLPVAKVRVDFTK